MLTSLTFDLVGVEPLDQSTVTLADDASQLDLDCTGADEEPPTTF